MKCGKCRTAHYCDKTCQRSHWSTHKEFCEVWAETSQNNGEIPVAKIKKKMTQLIWLIRGLPVYTKQLFEEYLDMKRLGRRGCIEFYFESFEGLFEAINVLEGLLVVKEEIFYPMPFTPTYFEKPGGGPAGQIIPIRMMWKDQPGFAEAVDAKMTFTETTADARPNLMNCLDMVGESETIFVICVTVQLQGTYSTHMYDFIYKRLSWYPEDLPTPSPKNDEH